jgi:AraC-like DNA-binding protein
MRPAAEWVYLLLMLGAAQGVFLAVLLATKRTNVVANRLLAIVMLSFSLFIVQGVYYALEWYLTFPHFIGVSRPLIYLAGPLLYLYTRTVSEGRHSFNKKWLLHLIPFALVALYSLPRFLSDGPTKVARLQRLLSEGPRLDQIILEQLQYPYGILYVVLTIALVRRHEARLQHTHSYVEQINLLWLRNLTIGIAAVWLVASAFNLLEIAGFEVGEFEELITSIAVAILVYAIGYLGLKQPEIFHPPSQIQVTTESSAPAPEASAAAHAPDGGADTIAYEKSGLSEAQAEAYLAKLLRLMEEKRPFTNSFLTLQDLADQMSISAHNLSQVINTRLGKNFYEFVNGYRIEEVKRRLSDPKSRHLTILAIGLDSGFNTKSTFNAFFKKYTGLTPSRYINQHRGAA